MGLMAVADEARLRLARLLQRLGRTSEAVTHLADQRLKNAPDPSLQFLQRLPTERERASALKYLTGIPASQRNTYFEDLAWSLANKIEFLFSY